MTYVGYHHALVLSPCVYARATYDQNIANDTSYWKHEDASRHLATQLTCRYSELSVFSLHASHRIPHDVWNDANRLNAFVFCQASRVIIYVPSDGEEKIRHFAHTCLGPLLTRPKECGGRPEWCSRFVIAAIGNVPVPDQLALGHPFVEVVRFREIGWVRDITALMLLQRVIKDFWSPHKPAKHVSRFITTQPEFGLIETIETTALMETTTHVTGEMEIEHSTGEQANVIRSSTMTQGSVPNGTEVKKNSSISKCRHTTSSGHRNLEPKFIAELNDERLVDMRWIKSIHNAGPILLKDDELRVKSTIVDTTRHASPVELSTNVFRLEKCGMPNGLDESKKFLATKSESTIETSPTMPTHESQQWPRPPVDIKSGEHLPDTDKVESSQSLIVDKHSSERMGSKHLSNEKHSELQLLPGQSPASLDEPLNILVSGDDHEIASKIQPSIITTKQDSDIQLAKSLSDHRNSIELTRPISIDITEKAQGTVPIQQPMTAPSISDLVIAAVGKSVVKSHPVVPVMQTIQIEDQGSYVFHTALEHMSAQSVVLPQPPEQHTHQKDAANSSYILPSSVEIPFIDSVPTVTRVIPVVTADLSTPLTQKAAGSQPLRRKVIINSLVSTHVPLKTESRTASDEQVTSPIAKCSHSDVAQTTSLTNDSVPVTIWPPPKSSVDRVSREVTRKPQPIAMIPAYSSSKNRLTCLCETTSSAVMKPTAVHHLNSAPNNRLTSEEPSVTRTENDNDNNQTKTCAFPVSPPKKLIYTTKTITRREIISQYASSQETEPRKTTSLTTLDTHDPTDQPNKLDEELHPTLSRRSDGHKVKVVQVRCTKPYQKTLQNAQSKDQFEITQSPAISSGEFERPPNRVVYVRSRKPLSPENLSVISGENESPSSTVLSTLPNFRTSAFETKVYSPQMMAKLPSRSIARICPPPWSLTKENWFADAYTQIRAPLASGHRAGEGVLCYGFTGTRYRKDLLQLPHLVLCRDALCGTGPDSADTYRTLLSVKPLFQTNECQVILPSHVPHQKPKEPVECCKVLSNGLSSVPTTVACPAPPPAAVQTGARWNLVLLYSTSCFVLMLSVVVAYFCAQNISNSLTGVKSFWRWLIRLTSTFKTSIPDPD